jgi:hypothetical protein
MSTASFIGTVRLFIDGLSDDVDASTIDARARSLSDVIGCCASFDGLCTIQVRLPLMNTVDDAELRLIKQLTFDK